MTVLSEFTASLQRELAVPGTFADVFPDTTTEDLTAALADGFSEAQLRGFFSTLSLTAITGPPADWQTSEPLSGSGGALIVIFTSMRIIRAQLRALNTAERYRAGPTEVEFGKSAMLLREELQFLAKRLAEIIEQAQRAARAASSVAVFDNYLARGGPVACSAFYPYEYKG